MSLIVAAVKGESSVNWQIYNAYSKDLNNYIKYLQINLEDKKKKKKGENNNEETCFFNRIF